MIAQVLLIGGSTGILLEKLEVIGDVHDVSPGEVTCLSTNIYFAKSR